MTKQEKNKLLTLIGPMPQDDHQSSALQLGPDAGAAAAAVRRLGAGGGHLQNHMVTGRIYFEVDIDFGGDAHQPQSHAHVNQEQRDDRNRIRLQIPRGEELLQNSGTVQTRRQADAAACHFCFKRLQRQQSKRLLPHLQPDGRKWTDHGPGLQADLQRTDVSFHGNGSLQILRKAVNDDDLTATQSRP
ncbi:hypothetical protein F2P81_021574 [Scophthalmus maximus]|uniref:Uncharacterized protein n=1 Tax=Scophthalmus maximus TaxID=52904 RepID=A0A6A4S1I9_SCOMX|nr:hypothetical protein F2P81_021574 [Scophthalmus maximus]